MLKDVHKSNNVSRSKEGKDVMSDFDSRVTLLVEDVKRAASRPLAQLGLRLLFPVWFGMMAFVVRALVAKLESVYTY